MSKDKNNAEKPKPRTTSDMTKKEKENFERGLDRIFGKPKKGTETDRKK